MGLGSEIKKVGKKARRAIKKTDIGKGWWKTHVPLSDGSVSGAIMSDPVGRVVATAVATYFTAGLASGAMAAAGGAASAGATAAGAGAAGAGMAGTAGSALAGAGIASTNAATAQALGQAATEGDVSWSSIRDNAVQNFGTNVATSAVGGLTGDLVKVGADAGKGVKMAADTINQMSERALMQAIEEGELDWETLRDQGISDAAKSVLSGGFGGAVEEEEEEEWGTETEALDPDIPEDRAKMQAQQQPVQKPALTSEEFVANTMTDLGRQSAYKPKQTETEPQMSSIDDPPDEPGFLDRVKTGAKKTNDFLKENEELVALAGGALEGASNAMSADRMAKAQEAQAQAIKDRATKEQIASLLRTFMSNTQSQSANRAGLLQQVLRDRSQPFVAGGGLRFGGR